MGQLYHSVETLDLGSYQIIKIPIVKFKNMKNHGRNGRFTMTSGNYDSLLIYILLVDVFRIGVNF